MRLTGEGRECLEDITGLRRRLYLALRSISENMKIIKISPFLTFIILLLLTHFFTFVIFVRFVQRITVIQKKAADNTKISGLLGLHLLIYIPADTMSWSTYPRR